MFIIAGPILFLLSILSCCSSAKLNVSIVVIGYTAGPGLASLYYTGPQLIVATENAQQIYDDTLNITLNFLHDDPFASSSCNALLDNMERMAAEWWYQQRDGSALTVFVIPACFETSNFPFLPTQWNTLWISTLASTSLLTNRLLCPTWISTTSIPMTAQVQLYLNLLNRYNWTSMAIVLDIASVQRYATLAYGVIEELAKITSSIVPIFKIVNTKKDDIVDFEFMLKDFSRSCRVILYFGHAKWLRQMLITAAKMNMTNGEYVYIANEVTLSSQSYGNLSPRYNDTDDEMALQAFQSLIVLQTADLQQPVLHLYADRIKEVAMKEYNFSFPLHDSGIPTLSGGYSGIMALASVLNETYTADPKHNFHNGTDLALHFLNRTFTSDVGSMYIDSNGERRISFTVCRFTAHGKREPFLQQFPESESLVQLVVMERWGLNSTWPPSNEPLCGYTGKNTNCQPKVSTAWILQITIPSLAVIFLIGLGVVIYIWIMRSRALLDPWWKIEHLTSVKERLISCEESCAETIMSAAKSRRSSSSMPMKLTLDRDVMNARDMEQRILHVKVKLMDEIRVAIIPVGICSSMITLAKTHPKRSLLLLLKQFRSVDHPNLVAFYGLTVIHHDGRFSSQLAIVSAYPARGCLADVFDGAVNLDFGLRCSFILDFLSGIGYIHNSSPLGYHGQLSTLRCWLDHHFTLQITHLAMDRLQQEMYHSFDGVESYQAVYREQLYWTTPESLVINIDKNIALLQKRDIFSCGYVIYEVLMAQLLTFKIPNLENAGDVRYDKHNILQEATDFTSAKQFESVLTSCWNYQPDERPTIDTLRKKLGPLTSLLKVTSGVTSSRYMKPIEKIMQQLEEYNQDLEMEVRKRTKNLTEEMHKCDDLVAQFIPISLVKQLRTGEPVFAEYFECVTLMFTDLYGFADFINDNDADSIINVMGLVEMLLDKLSSKCGVYKVEAVADSYIVASGLPIRNGIDHVKQVAIFALEMMSAGLEDLTLWKYLRLRMGMHSGPCAAGVLGTRRPRYCVFGDTMNMASRMCSHGAADRIHLSPASADLLRTHWSPQFIIEPRGVITVKGKGATMTSWLKKHNAVVSVAPD